MAYYSRFQFDAKKSIDYTMFTVFTVKARKQSMFTKHRVIDWFLGLVPDILHHQTIAYRILQRAHRKHHVDVNCVDSLGRGALTIAIDAENLEMVELLVIMSVETKDALLQAINAEFVEAVELLLEVMKHCRCECLYCAYNYQHEFVSLLIILAWGTYPQGRRTLCENLSLRFVHSIAEQLCIWRTNLYSLEIYHSENL